MSQYSNLNWQYPGLADVGSYQVSAIPFVTGGITVSSTPIQITFPSVTSWIYVVHHDNDTLRVGFSANGVSGSNYFLVPGAGTNGLSQTPVLPVKCSSIFLMRDNAADVSDVSIFAGLTSILTNELANSGPKGTNWSGSSGIG